MSTHPRVRVIIPSTGDLVARLFRQVVREPIGGTIRSIATMQLAEAERLVAVTKADLDIARNVLAMLAGVAEVGARKCTGSEDSEGYKAECRTHCLLLFTWLVG